MSKKAKTKSKAAGSKGAARGQSTPRRPVVSLALILFVPTLWLALNGNLSVQTALFRFLGALLVSWVAAQVVLATVNSCIRSGPRVETVGSASDSATGLADRRKSSDADEGPTNLP